MITEQQYLAAKAIVEQYEKLKKSINFSQCEFDNNDEWEDSEPCNICGDIDGMVNECCVGYDKLHFKNCGYG